MFNTQSQASQDYILFVKIENVKSLSLLLKAVHIRETAVVFATDKGLKVVVDDSKCAQAIAFIEASVFHEYKIKQESVSFVINLTVLLECLNIFGNGNAPGVNTALQLCYAGHGSPLAVILEEAGVITDCQLKTLEPEDILDFDFSATNVTNKVILKSDVMKEIWNDLDTATDVLEILMSPNSPHLSLSTFGPSGTVQIQFSRDSDIIETFQCTQSQTNRYKMSLMKPTNKALSASSKLCIRTDDRGFLNIQYMINIEGNQTCFVEYYVAPDEDFDD